MAKTFVYRAKDRSGQNLSGTIVADSQAAVAAYIRDKGYFVTNIKEVAGQSRLIAFLHSLQRVTTKDLAIFCRLFATMTDAGLSLIIALSVIIEQTGNSRLKQALQEVHRRIQEGDTLSGAMGQYPEVFPPIMINMIEAGETGGVLDTVLNQLAVHFEKEHKMNEKIKTAMTYPAVVVGMAVLAVTFILTFVLPTFVQMFTDMKVELPPLTRALLAVSGFLKEYGFILLPAVLLAGYGVAIFSRKPDVKAILDPIMLRLPVFGMLLRKIAIARFSRTLGTLVRGGVPIIGAIEVVKKTTANSSMMQALNAAQTSIREGLGLAIPLGASAMFTPMVIHMVAIGEETGELDRMLEKIADFYESDVDDTVSRLSSMLEPILIGVLGVIIGVIILSVALPMFDVVTNFGR